MKLLHIGKKGNVERYTKENEFTREFEVVDVPMDMQVPQMLLLGGDADFIIADAMAPVAGDLIAQMPNLRLLHSEGVGYNFFDLETARKCSVYVCNCRGMNARAVAEQTIMLMLGVLRDAAGGDRAVREGRQIAVKENYMKEGNLLELSDLKVGLYGFGDIAKATARILKVMEVETFYFSRHRVPEELETEYGVKYLPVEELLSVCDMISLHIPVTPETKEIVNDDFLAKMKDGSYLINTARGELVDSGALLRAMENGKIRKAGLDCIAGEPVQTDNVLLKAPDEITSRILFSPHIGGVTASSFRRGYEMAWTNIRRTAESKRPFNVVNGL